MRPDHRTLRAGHAARGVGPTLVTLAILAAYRVASAQDATAPSDDAGVPAEGVFETPREGAVVPAETVLAAPDAPADDADGDANDGAAEDAFESGVRGRIVDSRTGAGLADAVVTARGASGGASTITDETGRYALSLPPGVYSVMALLDLYHGARMPRVRVRSARWTDLVLTLDPIDETVVAEEVEIVYRADTSSSAAQDQLRAASRGIGEGMGSAQMSRSGASDAAGAARSAAGVTIEGASLNIRGLGGRYTLVLLNGVPLPSTDPDVPSVDLDLFPTGVIESLFISKAFQPDLPASFAGGVLDIRTVRFPRRFTFELGGSVGTSTLTLGREAFGYRGGDLDWLGLDDGTRAMPSGLDDRLVISSRTRPTRYTTFEQLEAEAERFPNIWAVTPQTLGPSFSLELTLGDAIDLGGRRRFGYLATAGYAYDSAFFRTESARLFMGDREAYRYSGGTTREEVALHALGTASLELGRDDVVSFLTLYDRVATDETSLQSGRNHELGGPIERWQLSYIARSMWLNQLRGDHRNLFGSRLRLRWTAYGAHASRDEPDRRTVTYGPQGALVRRWLEKSQSGERFYSSLEQLDFGGLFDLRFPLWSEAWGTVGGHVRTTHRSFLNRRFRMMQDTRATDQSAFQADVEELFGEEGIGTLTRIQEFSRGDDSYLAEQRSYALFAMLETSIAGPLGLTGGARFEAFEQSVASRTPIPLEQQGPLDEEVRGTDRTDFDVLPAASLRLELADDVVLRAAYGMTVARPQIRELAPYQYYDFVRDRNVQGNPDLARTLIQNADLRWEWFFGEGEILALSVFYKYFDRPIELLIRNQQNYDSQFQNALYAHNVGGEVELRFNFRHFAPELRVLSFDANLALVWSTVELPPELSGAIRSERPLFGQSPYVANLSLHLDEPASGLRASLVYNLTGPRLSDVGTRQNDTILPDIYRQPFSSLDVVLTWQVHANLRLRLKLKNLLFQEEVFVQGDSCVVARNEPGMSGSLSLTYTH